MVTLSQVFAHNILKHASSRCPAGRTGRPRTLVDTEALSVLFKVTRTGMQWREVSATVSYASVFRRVQAWAEKGVVLDAYRETLRLYKKLVPTRHGIFRDPVDVFPASCENSRTNVRLLDVRRGCGASDRGGRHCGGRVYELLRDGRR